mmetsp:Transcript_35295/g.54040  ORF Transcript_35295/g.54040 Transcript_35295/m.54040 type:complete len:106 (-) Transcript_35295:161-478(-)
MRNEDGSPSIFRRAGNLTSRGQPSSTILGKGNGAKIIRIKSSKPGPISSIPTQRIANTYTRFGMTRQETSEGYRGSEANSHRDRISFNYPVNTMEMLQRQTSANR